MSAPELRDYQHEAVRFLRSHRRAGLFLDMGLGKTASTLTALTAEHLPALVVAPKRVVTHVWPSETDTWRPDLTIRTAVGTPAQRREALESDADIVVISLDTLGDALTAKRLYHTLVIDELSCFKSRQSRRWKTAKRLIADKSITHVWGLTGTPAPNSYLDLWAQAGLLDSGRALGTSITRYRGEFFTPGTRLPNGVITRWDLRPGSADAINARLQPLCLSMSTEGRVDLPPVVENVHDIDLPPAASRLYQSMLKTMVADASELPGGKLHVATTAAARNGKLAQISAGFLYDDDRESDTAHTPLHTAKASAAREIVDGTGSGGVLVFYQYVREREMLRAAMEGLAYADVREAGAIERWNAGKLRVLLAHPASAGHGLNLQAGGHTIVWVSLPWQGEQWEQGNKRLHRSGQRQTVVRHILAAAPIDRKIRRALELKISVQDYLLNALESPL